MIIGPLFVLFSSIIVTVLSRAYTGHLDKKVKAWARTQTRGRRSGTFSPEEAESISYVARDCAVRLSFNASMLVTFISIFPLLLTRHTGTTKSSGATRSPLPYLLALLFLLAIYLRILIWMHDLPAGALVRNLNQWTRRWRKIAALKITNATMLDIAVVVANLILAALLAFSQ